ncbi:MAG: flagellar hook-basal body complex protein, partial [Aquabacterium sp.]
DVRLSAAATGHSTGTGSSLAVEKVDGRPAGSITKFGFDDTGTLVVSYSNGQTRKGGQLAIAEIGDMDQLEQVSGALFRYSGSNPVNLTVAGTRTKLATASLELSNVDLTDQLSSLILVQRGYQASSQVLSTASEMIQDLYEMKSRR